MVVAAFNQEKALVGAFSVIANLRFELQLRGWMGFMSCQFSQSISWVLVPSPDPIENQGNTLHSSTDTLTRAHTRGYKLNTHNMVAMLCWCKCCRVDGISSVEDHFAKICLPLIFIHFQPENKLLATQLFRWHFSSVGSSCRPRWRQRTIRIYYAPVSRFLWWQQIPAPRGAANWIKCKEDKLNNWMLM